MRHSSNDTGVPLHSRTDQGSHSLRDFLTLLLLVAIAYAGAPAGVFQFDDYNVIVDLDVVHSAAAWWEDTGQGIRPLLKLTYLLNWLSSWGTTGFIGVNVLVHGAVVLLVFHLAKAMLAAQCLHDKLPFAAWAAAALFAVHPANTEAVTYISGRSTSLMALLYLAGIAFHAMNRTARNVPPRWWQHSLPPVCFALALGVKETAVTFPVALLLWDMACGARFKVALRNAWPSWLLLALAVAFFMLNDAYRAAMGRSLEFNTLQGNAATQLTALTYLLRQWAMPVWLNIDPDLTVQHDFSQSLPGVGLLLTSIALMLSTWRKRPWICFAVAWALLHWLPLYLFLPRLDVANDRQLYLAIGPLGLALAIELQMALSRPLAVCALGALLWAGGLLTVQRNQQFHSEVALWEQTVQVSPDKSRVHNNLGYAYKEAGRNVEARHEYLRALQLDADNIKARLNLRRLNAELKATQ